jgi:hypothetical protein
VSPSSTSMLTMGDLLRETIPFINLLQELKDMNFIDNYATPKILCKAFENHSGALELA